VILDLNAKRAARAAKRGEAMQMVLGDETFDLVDELPLEIGELAEGNRIGEAFDLMLRYPEADVTLKSAASSITTGQQSSQTSSTSTESTSPVSASDAALSTPVASSA